jgi:enoyl-CoA hydratase/carnithine racemase
MMMARSLLPMDFGGGDEIRFERVGRAGIVTLTRPQALNAVTHRMITALARGLDAWEADDAVRAVLIRGEGRAVAGLLPSLADGVEGMEFIMASVESSRNDGRWTRLSDV